MEDRSIEAYILCLKNDRYWIEVNIGGEYNDTFSTVDLVLLALYSTVHYVCIAQQTENFITRCH